MEDFNSMNIGRINFAPSPTPADDLSAIIKLADHIRDLEIDRHELQTALDDQIALVQQLQNEIEILLEENVK
jgi:hypothetical protein